MAIKGLTRSEFEAVMAAYVRPSDAIDSFEHLVGRGPQLERIEEAVVSPGKHVFIYGDRGAGKTSLAQTIAHAHNPSSSTPVLVACGKKTTFSSIVYDVAAQLVGRSRFSVAETSRAQTVQLSLGPFSGISSAISGGATEKLSERLIDVVDLNAASALLSEAANFRGGRSIVVIDEFENLPALEDRQLFAELIKQLSDRKVPVTLVFCGIGKSLDDLLHGHASSHRYLHEEKLPTPPLNFGQQWEIVDAAAARLGLSVNSDSRLRIAQVSDGFPHYVHLICEKLFWRAFRADEEIEELSPEDYMAAVQTALNSVEARLRAAYDLAVKKDLDQYQEVLWAVADHYELSRNTQSIYSNSYERIMEARGRTPLAQKTFMTRLTALKSPRHGSILTGDRRGWIRFSENLIRGYVRLVAEASGVRLALEHEPAPPPKVLTANTGRRGIDPAAPRRSYGSWGKGI
jgi:energy-coupling factor transporter ATP-binding protein EcfA2